MTELNTLWATLFLLVFLGVPSGVWFGIQIGMLRARDQANQGDRQRSQSL